MSMRKNYGTITWLFVIDKATYASPIIYNLPVQRRGRLPAWTNVINNTSTSGISIVATQCARGLRDIALVAELQIISRKTFYT